MAREQLKSIDITNVPELLRLVEEVSAANEPRVLRCENQDVAIVRPSSWTGRTTVMGRLACPFRGRILF